VAGHRRAGGLLARRTWHGTVQLQPRRTDRLAWLFVDRANLDSSDVRREIQSVHDLLDPPVRRAKPDITDEQHTAKAPEAGALTP
jgi:hypothetical protein